MMRHKYFLLIIIFCLAACAPTNSTAAPPTAATRSASLSEVTGPAQTLAAPGTQWLEAGIGQQIAAGGGVQTGIDGRVRLDISDGTIMRLAPETEFILDVFSPSAENPTTTFLLEAGHVFIQVTKELGSGSFELKTPSGVAAVRGSLMAVEFHPANGHMIATCLEGACRLTANSGNFTELAAGQQAGIRTFNAEQPTNAITIDSMRLNEWLREFPEAANLANIITPGPPPTPTQVP